MKLTGFVPCRAGSERVKDKNTRPFGGIEGGLIELKLRQLAAVARLDEIIVSSNDERILEFADRFAKSEDSRVVALPRPDEFGRSSTSMGQFITDYIAHLRQDGLMLWTHVTHPFVTASIYNGAIDAYARAADEGHDSLLSATRLQTFLWRDGKPWNYDNSVEKWPRSQDIAPVWEINHAIYMLPFDVMRRCGDRVGAEPLLFEIGHRDAMDIDWEDQFLLMNDVFLARTARGENLV